MSTPSTPAPLYPKTLTRTLILSVSVSSLDEEKYFLSSDLTDNLLGDLHAGFFPEIGLTLLSADGKTFPKV